ncbi:helix-turn-helix transcriptional regulator [Tissierella carlieri]|uniref:Helix-turn-helix transcriptional regulator n=1 Tax=Tissierella carlieri TaxID=689904 RepID=A0ABT1S6W8_9FIRM|nr:helix-turn-helix transcriptional regulator [Tissierella carlieri]MCQ4922227.1 helix-turn-helix transcriptional regulator [Tissierella carlieri]
MAANRSFTEYVKDRFYNNLYSAVENYIEQNINNLDLKLQKVINIGEVSLVDIEFKWVVINDLPKMKIEFDVVVDAGIEVTERNYRYDNVDECSQWFMIRCSGDLDNDLDDFQINNICIYNQKNKQPNPLSDSLVPYIYKEDLEEVATEFIRKYYPEALKTPMAIEPQELAKRMDLDVKVKRITQDFSIFGQIYFHDCNAEFYDEEEDMMVETSVEGRTIFVDPQAYYLRNLGAVNNTIVHECVHWDKHRKAFELERLYNSSASKIKCEVVGGIKDNNKEVTDWMEWQANALAPRIQMPLSTFKMRAFEFIKQYKKEKDTTEIIDIIEPVIDDLATFFCVSRLAAKIRMVDVGYEEAIGAFIYIDGRYVRPHRFKKGILEKNQTFSISVVDAIIQRIANPQLNSIVENGTYQFVDSHFVLNHPKYLTQDLFGQTILTDYARTHMEECCLIFDLSVQAVYKGKYYSECFLNRDSSSNIIFEAKFADNNEENTSQNEMIKKYNKDLLDVAMRLPMSLAGTLDALIRWSEMTEEDLAWESQLSEKTIQRLRNGEPDNVTIETIVQLCIGMKLPPVLSNYLVRNSGNSFMMTEQHMMYQFLLNCCYTKSLDECNEMLVAQNLKMLGKKNRSKEIA